MEARRLATQLAAFPTSQAHDEGLLARGVDDAGAPLDWHMRRLIEFRVQRKRALRCAPVFCLTQTSATRARAGTC